MPNIISNANVYLNGNNLVGRAKEVELPEVEATTVEHEALGLYGTVEYPVGIEPMKMTITWASFYPEWAEPAADFWQSVEVQVRTQVEDFQPTGRIATVPLIVTVRGMFKTNPLGSFSQKEEAEFESTISATYVKQVLGRNTILEYDAIANIYRVNGRDRLAGFRANLGV